MIIIIIVVVVFVTSISVVIALHVLVTVRTRRCMFLLLLFICFSNWPNNMFTIVRFLVVFGDFSTHKYLSKSVFIILCLSFNIFSCYF